MEEKTPKTAKKQIIKIDFGEPLPNIKSAQNTHQKPQESKIQGKNTAQSEEIAKIPEISNSAQETDGLITMPEIPLSELPDIEPKQENEFEKLKELEKKLKEQKELLKVKEKEEKIKKKLEEKLKGKRSLINPLRWFGLKYKKKKELKLEEEIKEPEILEKQSPTEIKLTEDFSNLKFCPVCNCKLKKGKVRKKGEIYTQNLKCKNKNCNFTKEIIFKL
jgi:hypothetical protein